MARAVTASPIQIPGLNKKSLQRRFYGETSSPNRCGTPDRQKRAAGMTISYVGDHFATLGVSPGTSRQEIKTAYRRLALQYHPDVCKGDYCATKFKQIKTAYERAMNAGASPSGSYVDDFYYDSSSITSEGLMGVNDDLWEDWEEWMGWEGAGTRDYTSHINSHL
ncbi:hypothetical protein O6H91_02G096400 [Diphasiastrum complanatum]|uniref:Uncharacterized protein n=1 Tax=Diphasiastrum complanatum TaxID=34168 RepID=A0ACC2EIH3_DIPCM|nr:hypothetical protein O6H91_02G096400 [Diphasiastrum complanatum]